MSSPKLTAAVIARDEAAHLSHCLDSLSFADSLLVLVDSRTRDQTAIIARERGAAVFIHEFGSFPLQRNRALKLADDVQDADWVLFVDADERVSSSLAREIRLVIRRNDADSPVGYWIPRRNFIWGGWIRHGGWSPDHQLRLLKTRCATYDEKRDVHELVELRGSPGSLEEPFFHFNYDGFGQFFQKQAGYARLDAQRLNRYGLIVRPHNFVVQPVREFRRRYLSLRGYRDGWRGVVLAGLLAGYVAATYALALWEDSASGRK